MKLFGSITELVSLIFRKNSQTITVRPNQATTYTAARDVQLPPQDANSVIVSENASQTLTNKTLTGNIAVSLVSGAATVTLPTTTSNLATIGLSETLTNKTLTSPVINSPTGIVKADVGLSNVDNTSDATKNSATVALTNKTIDGDNQTLIQNIGIASLKQVVGDANKALVRNGTGDVISALIDDTNIAAAANITATKLGTGIVDNTEFNRLNSAGTAGAGNLVTTNGTQQLTAKDYAGGTASNTSRLTVPSDTKANLDGLTRKEATIVYATDTDKLYADNGSTLIQVGASSGAGEINAVLNSSGTDNTTGWTSGTSHTLSRQEGSGPLDPIVSTAFLIEATSTASESSTSGSYYSISSLASGLRSKKLKVEFYYTTEASQTWAVSVYQGTTRLSLSTDASGATLLPSGVTGKFTAYFDTTTATTYSVNVTRTAGSGTANLYATSFVVGPGIQPQGSVVGEWKVFTSSILGATSNPTKGGTIRDKAYYRRVGDSMEVRWEYLQTSAGASGSGNYRFQLPLGLTHDSTKVGQPADGSFSEKIGTAIIYDGTNKKVCHIYPETTTGVVLETQDGNTWGSGDFALGNTNIRVGFFFTTPIAEWAGSGTLNTAQNDVEYASNSSSTDADDTTSFVYGPAGSTGILQTTALTDLRKKRVRFLTPHQAGDEFEIEVFDGFSYIPVDKFITTDGTRFTIGDLRAGISSIATTETQGIGFRSVNSTDVDVFFGRYITNETGFTTAWNSGFSGLSSKWRVKRTKAGVAVGFGLATATETGLVKGGTVPGSTSGAATAAGNIGEVIEFTRGIYSVNSSTPDVVQSLGTLQKGLYMVSWNWLISGSASLFCEARLRKTTGGVTVNYQAFTLTTASTNQDFNYIFRVDTAQEYEVTVQNSSGGGTITIEGDNVNQTGSAYSSHRYQIVRIG